MPNIFNSLAQYQLTATEIAAHNESLAKNKEARAKLQKPKKQNDTYAQISYEIEKSQFYLELDAHSKKCEVNYAIKEGNPPKKSPLHHYTWFDDVKGLCENTLRTLKKIKDKATRKGDVFRSIENTRQEIRQIHINAYEHIITAQLNMLHLNSNNCVQVDQALLAALKTNIKEATTLCAKYSIKSEKIAATIKKLEKKRLWSQADSEAQLTSMDTPQTAETSDSGEDIKASSSKKRSHHKDETSAAGAKPEVVKQPATKKPKVEKSSAAAEEDTPARTETAAASKSATVPVASAASASASKPKPTAEKPPVAPAPAPALALASKPPSAEPAKTDHAAADNKKLVANPGTKSASGPATPSSQHKKIPRLSVTSPAAAAPMASTANASSATASASRIAAISQHEFKTKLQPLIRDGKDIAPFLAERFGGATDVPLDFLGLAFFNACEVQNIVAATVLLKTYRTRYNQYGEMSSIHSRCDSPYLNSRFKYFIGSANFIPHQMALHGKMESLKFICAHFKGSSDRHLRLGKMDDRYETHSLLTAAILGLQVDAVVYLLKEFPGLVTYSPRPGVTPQDLLKAMEDAQNAANSWCHLNEEQQSAFNTIKECVTNAVRIYAGASSSRTAASDYSSRHAYSEDSYNSRSRDTAASSEAPRRRESSYERDYDARSGYDSYSRRPSSGDKKRDYNDEPRSYKKEDRSYDRDTKRASDYERSFDKAFEEVNHDSYGYAEREREYDREREYARECEREPQASAYDDSRRFSDHKRDTSRENYERSPYTRDSSYRGAFFGSSVSGGSGSGGGEDRVQRFAASRSPARASATATAAAASTEVASTSLNMALTAGVTEIEAMQELRKIQTTAISIQDVKDYMALSKEKAYITKDYWEAAKALKALKTTEATAAASNTQAAQLIKVNAPPAAISSTNAMGVVNGPAPSVMSSTANAPVSASPLAQTTQGAITAAPWNTPVPSSLNRYTSYPPPAPVPDQAVMQQYYNYMAYYGGNPYPYPYPLAAGQTAAPESGNGAASASYTAAQGFSFNGPK